MHMLEFWILHSIHCGLFDSDDGGSGTMGVRELRTPDFDSTSFNLQKKLLI
jgi:hypothetical protein